MKEYEVYWTRGEMTMRWDRCDIPSGGFQLGRGLQETTRVQSDFSNDFVDKRGVNLIKLHDSGGVLLGPHLLEEDQVKVCKQFPNSQSRPILPRRSDGVTVNLLKGVQSRAVHEVDAL